MCPINTFRIAGQTYVWTHLAAFLIPETRTVYLLYRAVYWTKHLTLIAVGVKSVVIALIWQWAVPFINAAMTEHHVWRTINRTVCCTMCPINTFRIAGQTYVWTHLAAFLIPETRTVYLLYRAVYWTKHLTLIAVGVKSVVIALIWQWAVPFINAAMTVHHVCRTGDRTVSGTMGTIVSLCGAG